MTTVFLSSARADREIADPVCAALAKRFHVFREQGIVFNDPYNEPSKSMALRAQLDHADLVVVLWSMNAARSKWVKQEIDRAISAWSKGRLVLVRLDQTPLPIGLRDLQAIDLSARIETDRQGALNQLVHALKAAEPAMVAGSFRARPYLIAFVVVGFLMLVFFSGLAGKEASEGAFLATFLAGCTLIAVLIGAWQFSQRRAREKRLEQSRAAESADSNVSPDTIFVSFSTKDVPLVTKLTEAMKSEGFSPWIYTRADGNAGRYATQIVRAIKASRKVAVMCSYHSFQSDEVVRELYVAGTARKPFVAFFLDREPNPEGLPEAFEYFLTGFPFVPVIGRNDDALRTDIRRFLNA